MVSLHSFFLCRHFDFLLGETSENAFERGKNQILCVCATVLVKPKKRWLKKPKVMWM